MWIDFESRTTDDSLQATSADGIVLRAFIDFIVLGGRNHSAEVVHETLQVVIRCRSYHSVLHKRVPLADLMLDWNVQVRARTLPFEEVIHAFGFESLSSFRC